MFKVDNASASATQSLGAPGTGGFYTAGNMSLSIPPTTIDADPLNIVQDELSYVVTQNGLTLNKTVNNQVYQAITSQIAAAVYVETSRALTAESLKVNRTEIYNPYFASNTVYSAAFAASSAGVSLTVACSGYLHIIGSRNLSAQDTTGGNLTNLYLNGSVVDLDSTQSSVTLLHIATCTAGAQSVLIASTGRIDFSLHISLIFVPFLQ